MTIKLPTTDDINAVPGLRARVFRSMLQLQRYIWDGLKTTPSPETANFEAAIVAFLQFRSFIVTAGVTPEVGFALFEKLRAEGAFELQPNERRDEDVAEFMKLLHETRAPLRRAVLN
jgi:hypothetical protein